MHTSSLVVACADQMVHIIHTHRSVDEGAQISNGCRWNEVSVLRMNDAVIDMVFGKDLATLEPT